MTYVLTNPFINMYFYHFYLDYWHWLGGWLPSGTMDIGWEEWLPSGTMDIGWEGGCHLGLLALSGRVSSHLGLWA